MQDTPIGRKREWNELMAAMRDRRSAVIILAGQPGSGRTYMFSRLAEHGTRSGYRVIGWPEPLILEPTTNLNDIDRLLNALLTEGSADLQGTVSASAAGEEQTDLVAVGVKGFMKQGVRWLQQKREEEDRVLTTLFSSGDLIIGVDGYAPNPIIHWWITTRLIPRTREADNSIILIFIDRPESIARLRPFVDVYCELGRFNIEEIERHFEHIGAELRPPLTKEEVRGYAQAAAEDSSLISALGTVFKWGRKGGDRG